MRVNLQVQQLKYIKVGTLDNYLLMWYIFRIRCTRGSQVFCAFPFLLYSLSLELSERRRQCGVTSFQRTFVFIPILIVTSLGGSRVSRGRFSVDGSFFRKRRA
jgi:hypothetical protein